MSPRYDPVVSHDPDIIVVGGGAAGIMAAWRSSSVGARTLILEKTPRLGTKILISGGGKCNIVHDGPIEEVLRAFRPNEAKFIRPSVYRWTNAEIIDLFVQRGLEVYTRDDGRVFPKFGNAKDVVEVLRGYLLEAGVKVLYKSPVTELIVREGAVQGVRTDQAEYRCQNVIVSVGGSSYPASGTTGDGWRWLRGLGHKIVQLRAALAPIDTRPEHSHRAGVALRDCTLKGRRAGKEVARWRGDTLFTHHGVTGPSVLGLSREISESKEHGPTELEVDLCPNESFESLGESLRAYSAEHPKRLIKTWLLEYLPESLVAEFLDELEIEPDRPMAALPKKAKNRIIESLKLWKIGEAKRVVLEKGEVVAGGVSLDEVDPKTLESKLIRGLFLCGEVLDVAGPVGGYNLQAAFSTGYVAGEVAALRAIGSPNG